jgi:hypothetical protein
VPLNLITFFYSLTVLFLGKLTHIPNTNLYIGGGLNLFGGDGDSPFGGNRVMANAGYILDESLDFSVQASRTFNRNPGISGSLLMFGIGIRF